ncbi:MAG: alanine glycine permease, partial [Okeania sp. SIO2H7]|nr:alanine glycine permease [Okeania sp. SIO2H7]
MKRQTWLYILLFLLIPTVALAQEPETGQTFIQTIDRTFSSFVGVIFSILFFKIGGFPFIVLWLLIGAIFFTIRMQFINFEPFNHPFIFFRENITNPKTQEKFSNFKPLEKQFSGQEEW